MTVQSINRTYIGFSHILLSRLTIPILDLCLPKPANLILDPGIQIREQQGRDELGRLTRVRTFATGATPTCQIVFSHLQPEIIALRVGLQFAVGTFDVTRPKQLRITQGEYPAVGPEYAGHGIAADPQGRASIIRNGLSFPLTQEPFANYSAWKGTNDRFAIGPDAALAFSDNLVAAQEVCNMSIPISVTGRKLSEELVGDHQVNCMMVDTEGRVGFLIIPVATPNLSDAAIDFSQEQVSISMFVNTPPGACSAWTIVDTDLKVGCI